jgi:hypothetical protein
VPPGPGTHNDRPELAEEAAPSSGDPPEERSKENTPN